MIIKVLGKGAWGTSIQQPLQDNGHSVQLFGRGEVDLRQGDTVVLALPTNAIREALTGKNNVQQLRIINCSKGIDTVTNELPYQMIGDILPPTTNYFSLLGPSFANELKEKMPTVVNLGYIGNRDDAENIKRLFQTDYLRVHVVKNVESLELAGAMKNIYAIASGVADGLGYGMNTRIRLIITAIEEFHILCKGLGYPIDEHAVGGISGDFILTGSSTISRNFQFGQMLLQYPVEEVLQRINATVEGYASLSSIAVLIKKAHVALPLANFVAQCVSITDKELIKEKFLEYIKQI